MNFYSLSPLINVITSVILGVFVFSRNPQDRRYQTFLYFCLSVALWSMFYFAAQIAFDQSVALWLFRGLALGAIFIPVCYLHYLLVFLDVYRRGEKFIYYGYLGAVVFAGLNLTDFFITGVSRKLIFSYWPNVGFAFYPFFLLWIVYFFRGVQVLFLEYRKSTGFRRNQLRYVLLATSIGALGGATNIPLWFNIPLKPFGNVLVSGYMFILTHAILKYRLMDISVAVTRTGIFIALYTFILGLPFAAGAYFKDLLAGFLGPNWWFVPLGLMAVMATVGPFLYIFLEHRAEKRLLKDQLRYQHTIRQASVGMTRVRSLSRLFNLIAHIITKTVKISFAAIYLYEQKDREYVLQIVRSSQRAFLVRIPAEAPLVSWISMRRQSLIYEEIKILAEDSFDPVYERLEENMRVLGAAVVIPCFLEDKLLAVIFLGDKVSGQQYTPEDLNVFQVLASQAAMAIENAQFYEETRKMQEQIAQAEKMATIGTMADGLSHQINNRFHALSLIAQDTIDTISRTDASKCAPEIQNMLSAINHALERIKVNVMQGGEVAKGILKYTRTQQEGLQVLALDDVLNAAVEMVQYKIKLSEIDIVRDYSKDLPKLRGNFVQLEEAFFNFIDNGYDAIMELKNSSAERGYRGRIIISARAKTSDIMEIVVADNGIGIKSQHLDKVFTPFFTTKVSATARKGTGLGLYVIRRIITDSHKGKIRFESEYRMGTRFFLELPIACS